MNAPITVDQAKAALREWAAESDARTAASMRAAGKVAVTIAAAGLVERALMPRHAGGRLLSPASLLRVAAWLVPALLRARLGEGQR